MKTSITAAEARQQRQESGFILAYSSQHRLMKKELSTRGTSWKGLSTATETAKARRRS
jgi:hypothetical protein